MLRIEGLTKEFGGITAVSDLSFRVAEKQIKSIIGPNGAGKTTLFNLITGLELSTRGSISFLGKDISGLRPHKIAELGISRSFQNVEIFDNMNILENVMLGRHSRTRCGALSVSLRRKRAVEEEKAIRQEALRQIECVKLDADPYSSPASLPFGKRRLVEFARALATSPRLLLLDEPVSGLNIRESERVAELICSIRDSGITVMLVEHDMSVVMEISDDVLVMDHGVRIASGKPRDIQRHEEVIARYLGRSDNHAQDTEP